MPRQQRISASGDFGRIVMGQPENIAVAAVNFSGLRKEQQKRMQPSVDSIDSWQGALAYAKRRIKELQLSVKVFEHMIESGAPWGAAKG